jgi:hypothetical protein
MKQMTLSSPPLRLTMRLDGSRREQRDLTAQARRVIIQRVQRLHDSKLRPHLTPTAP